MVRQELDASYQRWGRPSKQARENVVAHATAGQSNVSSLKYISRHLHGSESYIDIALLTSTSRPWLICWYGISEKI